MCYIKKYLKERAKQNKLTITLGGFIYQMEVCQTSYFILFRLFFVVAVVGLMLVYMCTHCFFLCSHVRYLDFIDLGPIKMPSTLPRIRVWKGDLIKHFSEMDKGKDDNYGYHTVSLCLVFTSFIVCMQYRKLLCNSYVSIYFLFLFW